MFEIENCYRIIFEAMLDETVLLSIAERIEQYTDAGVAFVTGTGKIMAFSRLWSIFFRYRPERVILRLKIMPPSTAEKSRMDNAAV